jgi:hypothetical protein
MTLPVIHTKSLSIFAAKQFIESVSEPPPFTNLYLGVGKVESWANDASPPNPYDSISDKIAVYNNLLFAKKITGNDMILGVRRINWTQGQSYARYDSMDPNLFTSDFYVLTSDFNVYKCLDNANNSPSLIEPSYTSPGNTSRTSDGYLWKYMFTVKRSDRIRFLTSDFIPVREYQLENSTVQWQVQESATPGAIENIIVTNPGVNYNSSYQITVSISGDGSGASANVVRDTSNNSIRYVVVSSPGRNYTHAIATISSNNSNSSGATCNVSISPFLLGGYSNTNNLPLAGHGANPVEELGASTVIINVRLRGTENSKLVTGQDFRQVCIIKDPLVFSDSNVASNTICSQVTTIQLAGFGSPYIADEYVYQGPSLAASTFKGKMVYYDSSNNTIQVSNTEGIITSTSIIGKDSAASRFVIGYTDRDLQPYSGTILYIDNFAPITRHDDQVEDIKIPIQF